MGRGYLPFNMMGYTLQHAINRVTRSSRRRAKCTHLGNNVTMSNSSAAALYYRWRDSHQCTMN